MWCQVGLRARATCFASVPFSIVPLCRRSLVMNRFVYPEHAYAIIYGLKIWPYCASLCSHDDLALVWACRKRLNGTERAIACSASQPKEDSLNSPGDKAGSTDAEKKPVFSHALNESFAAEELMEELKDKNEFGKRGEVVLLVQVVTIFLIAFPPMRLAGVVYFTGVPEQAPCYGNTGCYRS